MEDPTEAAAVRQTAIIEAATSVFLRYGFKKTSMADLASAAGLSRQALYLYFPTKEALFKAMVAHSVQGMRSAAREALAREDLDLEGRLLSAFEAIHGRTAGSENLDELLATTVALVGPVVRDLEEDLITDVAHALRAASVATRWKETGVSAKHLAEHLSAVSDGIKRRAKTPAEYRDRMRIAVRLVCRSAPR
ncbi:MAG: TetR/AcrR family transcriptional regulator [Verrucomicrobia bacterium]|nr:TetR/AcrR family transcriptional regulator [Verrucomicrobiota bacterium]